MNKLMVIALIFAAAVCSLPYGYAEDDPLVLAPESYKKVFENEQVRVLELELKSGDKIVKHSHPDHFVYVMNDATISITKGAETKEVNGKKGEVIWIDAETHSAENTGPTDFRALVVELKRQ